MKRKLMWFALLTSMLGMGLLLLRSPTLGTMVWRIGTVWWSNAPATPLLISEIAHEATIILYRNPSEMGYYILWNSNLPLIHSNSHGMKWVSTEDYLSHHRPANEPVSLLVNFISTTEIIGITINDQQILPKAHTAKVVFADGSSVMVPIHNKEATIFSRKTSTLRSNYTSVSIYDAANQEVLKVIP
jgi:hypothetical protein